MFCLPTINHKLDAISINYYLLKIVDDKKLFKSILDRRLKYCLTVIKQIQIF